MNKKLVLSWVISIALLAIVAGSLNLNNALVQLSKISPFFLVLSLAVYSTGFIFRALRWKYLVKPLANLSIRDSFFIVNVSFLANGIFPARLGEFLRAYLLSKKKGIGKVKSFSTVAVDRVVDGVTLIFLFFFIMLFSRSVPAELQKIMILPVIVFAFGMGFFVKPDFFRKIFSPVMKKIPFVYDRVHFLLDDLVVGGKAFSQSLNSLIMIWASSFIIWGIEATNFLIIAQGMGISLSFFEIVLLLIIVAMASMIPIFPGSIGTFEGFFAIGFVALGLSAESGFAMAIAIHILEFIVIIILGIISLNMLGLSWKEFSKAEKKA